MIYSGIRPVILVWVVVLAVPFILLAFPMQSPLQIQKKCERYKELGLLRWENGRDHNLPQDFADMIGWSDLAKKVDTTYSVIAGNKYACIVR